jgi:hypothetical protein
MSSWCASRERTKPVRLCTHRVTALALVPSPPAEAALAQLEHLRLRLAIPDLPLEDALDARDQAEVLRGFAQQARLGLDVSNQAIEVKIRAERRAGSLLHAMLGNKKALRNGTLQQAGITPMQSSSWQLIAQIPEPEFEQRLHATKAAGRQLSSAAMVRAGRQFLRQPNQGGNGQVSPTLRRLRSALLLLRDVKELHTPAEVAAARAVVALADNWATVLEPPPTARAVGIVQREVTCLMCGRARPSNKPPKCPSCGGAWYA